MSKIADISEPARELEPLIADLSQSGLLVFVFGVGISARPSAGPSASG